MNEPIYFMRGQQRFEVRREPYQSDYPFAGYVDGKRSVAALTPEIAVQMLLKKHVVRRPKAAIIDFAAARRAMGSQ